MLRYLHNLWLHFWMRVTFNEYGTPESHHTCKTCKRDFIATPAVDCPIDWQHCLAPDCQSYDCHRDLEVLLGAPPPPGKPISLKVQRERRGF